MTPYGPVSLALLHDLRVRPLSWAERGVLHHLSLLAGVAPDGVTVHIDRKVGEAEVSAWARALGVEASAIIGRLIEVGLLVPCDVGVRVTLAARDSARASGLPAQHSVPPPPMQPAGKPSESPAAARARQDRSLFGRRMKQWSTVPAGITWESWIATEEGRAHVVVREATHPGYAARVTPLGGVTSQGHTPGSHRVTPLGHTPSLSPQTPHSLGKTEEEESKEGHTGSHPVTPSGGVTQPGHTQGSHGVASLDALRAAASGYASLNGAAALEQQLGEVLGRHALSTDEITAAGRAFAEPARWWPKGKNPAPRHVTLNDLAGFRGESGYEWRALAALVSHVRSLPRAAPLPAAPSKPAPARALPIAEVNRIAREAAEKARAQRSQRPIVSEVQHG